MYNSTCVQSIYIVIVPYCICLCFFFFFFFFNDPATTDISPLPLHDALPICQSRELPGLDSDCGPGMGAEFPVAFLQFLPGRLPALRPPHPHRSEERRVGK